MPPAIWIIKRGFISNHVRDGKNARYINATELSKHACELNRNKMASIIKWKILRKVCGNFKDNFWRLCLIKSFLIIKVPYPDAILKKRCEFISKCRLENKLLIINMK